MKYEAFINQVAPLAVFGSEVTTPLQLHRWVKEGKVLRLKRGFYTLPGDRRQVQFSQKWLANLLYSPSYLSLESILSWYDFLPERVERFTSVSLLKTQQLNNEFGRFDYHHIQKDYFFGFEEIPDEFGKMILLATPEKALLDWVYFSTDWAPSEKYLEESLRLQQIEKLRKSFFREYRPLFHSKKMRKAIDFFLKII